jgi:hypothetical protein
MGVLLPSSDIHLEHITQIHAAFIQDIDTSNIVDIYKAQPGSVGANIQITIATRPPQPHYYRNF